MNWRKFGIALLLTGIAGYAVVLTTLYVYQQRFIYPGWSRGTKALTPNLAGWQDVATVTEDGVRGRLLYRAPQPGKPVILFFHGNGDSVYGSMVSIAGLTAAGYGAVLPEFRGFNGSPGVPTEQGLYRDARAAIAWMRANRVGGDRLIVIGYSLGSGVATEMALSLKPDALLLVAPYASIPHVATQRLWFVPDFLVSERFDTQAKIVRIKCPILLLHGDRDGTIPVGNSVILKEANPAADRIVFPGVGHEIVFTDRAQATILRWLAAKHL